MMITSEMVLIVAGVVFGVGMLVGTLVGYAALDHWGLALMTGALVGAALVGGIFLYLRYA